MSGALTGSLILLAALTGAELPYEAPSGSGPAPDEGPHTKARLVAREDAAIFGQVLEVAIVLESAPGWHTYWLNPGDAGMATSVTWTLPKGWIAGDLAWPAPALHKEKEVATFGYSGETWMLATLVQHEATTPGGNVTFEATVDWLECREICLPGNAKLSLTLPFKGAKEIALPANGPKFTVARSRIPAPSRAWRLGATWTADRKLVLQLGTPVGITLGRDAFFFPYQHGILEPSGSAKLTALPKGGYSLELTPARFGAGTAPPMLEGVLVSGGGAWHVRVPLPPREI